MSPLNDCSSMRALPLPSVKLKRLLPSARALPFGQLDREVGAEVALERAHEHRGVRRAAEPDADVAAVRRQAIRAAVAHRPVEGDVAVDRRRLQARRLRVFDDDVAVGRFGGHVAGDVRQPDAFVDRRRLHLAGGLLDGDRCLRPSATTMAPEPPTTRTLP